MHDEEEDNTTYKVVLNQEEQYSIWPADRENAPGWRDEGRTGSKRECLDHIQNVWTDMRPLSLRKHMQQQEKAGTAGTVPVGVGRGSDEHNGDSAIDTLVGRLSHGRHRVVTSRYRTASELGDCVERGFVLVKFTGTRGGTELGFRLNADHTDTTGANFKDGVGTVCLGGDLTLDDVKVRCRAQIDLQSLAGEGYLELLS
jgi:uncharacterized protein YbdZ (MbtH family)